MHCSKKVRSRMQDHNIVDARPLVLKHKNAPAKAEVGFTLPHKKGTLWERNEEHFLLPLKIYWKVTPSTSGPPSSTIMIVRGSDDVAGNSPGVHRELAGDIGSLPGWRKGVHRYRELAKMAQESSVEEDRDSPEDYRG
ncbi:hypothetical protein BHM03_00019170 [Ensete ventricosum]|uniref:Uncharacterized protein n=1 Tax=Ensete ventricosum TaxID=4639 RepID=A0A445MFF7_ENSVE|nr:hypothetical protein BHM03_00019170 [Ensete ventricosum]